MTCLLCLGFWQFGQNMAPVAKAWVAQDIMHKNWERTDADSGIASQWPWDYAWPMARLSARNGEIDLVILSGGDDHALDLGPGHLSASALPGEPGNSIIAGHRDTHFNFLKDVAVGETLTVETIDGTLHVYTIVNLDVVDARRGSLALDTEGSVLSLVTGYPFAPGKDGRGQPMRYVVTAKKLL